VLILFDWKYLTAYCKGDFQAVPQKTDRIMPPVNPQIFLYITHAHAVAIPFSKLQKRV